MSSFLVPASVPPGNELAPYESEALDWRGPSGDSWAARNPKGVPELDALYQKRFGVTRTQMLIEWLARVPRDARVLEIGASAGAQLMVLRSLGFTNLQGIDLSEGAQRGSAFHPAVADAARLPFRDGAFDLVFTSGTLMHVPPSRRRDAIREILRVTRRWVFGTEYYSATPQAFRWDTKLLPPIWVEDFVLAFIREHPPVRVVRSQVLKPGDDGSPMTVYLIEKP